MDSLPPINQRVKRLINHYSNGVVRVFAEQLENVSQQTLNRLFNIDTRTKKYPIPTTDILVAITNMFVDVNPRWLLNGIGEMLVTPNELDKINANTPNDDMQKSGVSALKNANSDTPTFGKFDTPTDTPTHNNAPPTLNLGTPKVIAISENNEDLVTLVAAKAAAGYLNGYGDPEYIGNLPTIKMPGIRGGTHRAFEVKGHSMPTLPNSSIAVGRWTESIEDIRDRRIYIVVTKSEGIVIKRVLNRVHDTGKLILISDNQNKRDYPNIILDQSDVLELWYLRAGVLFDFPEPGELYGRFNDLEAKVTLMAEQLQNLSK
ncbi:S24/S26 family peptidase [Pedobacter sp. D749]|uniref:S24 family peptidase n=1 Tax=Pedobacter sp. D749 TaxID=2856523 RepID=UPI001C561B13|nr:S24/S26 family peptidase [Pedobacter sp. D749]QXU42062.1 S24/S26 family peptidase [Pedobacter sp. D749]